MVGVRAPIPLCMIVLLIPLRTTAFHKPLDHFPPDPDALAPETDLKHVPIQPRPALLLGLISHTARLRGFPAAYLAGLGLGWGLAWRVMEVEEKDGVVG